MKDNIVKRGYVPGDNKEFSNDNYALLLKAQKELFYLLNQGYPIKSASIFVGNHYMFSERQRLALVRATSSLETLQIRKGKCINDSLYGQTVHIDGLNLIITLEVALSGSILLQCMDNTIRDLAGLRGTYRLIDKTDIAINLIGRKLEELQIKKVNFYLDSPVSNTGRLKQRIMELLLGYSYEVQVELINNADVILEKLDNVITSDAIILNKCNSWINLGEEIIKNDVSDANVIDLRMK